MRDRDQLSGPIRKRGSGPLKTIHVQRDQQAVQRAIPYYGPGERHIHFIKVRNNEDIKRFAERFEMYLTHFPDGKPRVMIGASNIYNSIKELPSMYHDCLVTTMYRSKSGLVFFDQDDAARFLYPLFEDKYLHPATIKPSVPSSNTTKRTRAYL